jgi:hypothetical protein
LIYPKRLTKITIEINVGTGGPPPRVFQTHPYLSRRGVKNHKNKTSLLLKEGCPQDRVVKKFHSLDTFSYFSAR